MIKSLMIKIRCTLSPNPTRVKFLKIDFSTIEEEVNKDSEEMPKCLVLEDIDEIIKLII